MLQGINAQTLHWVGGSSNWNDAQNWSANVDGQGGAGIPNSHTDVVIAQSAVQEIVINSDAFCKSFTVQNLTQALILQGEASLFSYGDVSLHDSVQFAVNNWKIGGNNVTLKTANAIISSEVIVEVQGTVFLQSHFTADHGALIWLKAGNFMSNGYSVSSDFLKAEQGFGTIDISNSLIYISQGLSLFDTNEITQQNTKTLVYPDQMDFLQPGNLQFLEQQLPTCATGAGQTPFTIDAIVISNYNGEDISCNGADDGIASVTVSGGVGPFSYQWIGGDLPGFTQNYSNLGAGTYTVLVTDLGQGVTCVDNVQLAEPAPITIFSLILTPPSCTDLCNGTATPIAIGGVPGYNYQWSNGETGFMATALCEGSNTLTLTDSNGCGFDSTFVLERAELEFNLVLTPILCAGTATGSATASPSGGAGVPFTITWSNGDSGPIADNLSAGDYTLSVTDGLNCTLDTTFTITEEPPVVISENLIEDESCAGEMNGAINIDVSGGNTPYVFEWSGPNGFASANEDINALGAGTYTVTVTDANDCETTASFTVDAPPAISISGIVTPVACAGELSGAIDVTVSGGTPGYAISWSGPNGFNSNLMDISGLGAGDYTITVTDLANCVESETFTITESPEIVANESITEVSCNLGNDGAIAIDVSGGTPGFDFSWSGPNGFSSTNEDISALSSGTYTVTITDSNNCETEFSYTLNEPEIIEVSGNVTPVTCFGNNDGAISISISGGTPPYTTSWVGPNGFVGIDTAIFDLAPGTYTVTVVDANSCEVTQNFDVTEPTEILANPDITNITCGGLTDGAIALNPSGGQPNYTFEWTGPGGFNSASQNIANLDNGSYNLTITDSNNCEVDFVFDITEDPPLELNAVITDLDCNGADNGAIDLTITGGTPNFAISWLGPNGFSSSEEDLSGLVPGDYAVTVTDANNCIISANYTIAEPDPIAITVDLSPITCPGEADASIDISVNGGVDPYDFEWTGPNGFTASTEDITNLDAGTYDLNLTDQEGCTQQTQVIITEATEITVIPIITNVTCGGLADGIIEISILGGTPGYTTSWTGPNGFSSMNEDIANLEPGTYDLTVTDLAGCTEQLSYDITQQPPLEVVISIIDISCNGFNDGAVSLDISGGQVPYTIEWTGPNGFTSAVEDISNLEPGDYTFIITDFNDCVLPGSATVAEPQPIDASITAVNPSCFGANDGSITLVITGGVAPYDVQWSGGQNGEVLTGLGPGDYTATITDNSGCSLVLDAITLSESPEITIDFLTTDLICAGQPDGEIDITVSGGTPGYTFEWEGPDGFSSTDEDIAGLMQGSYIITITDLAGCTETDQIEITSPEILDIVFNIDDLVCAGDLGNILIDVSGGFGSYTFEWDGPNNFVSAQEDLIAVPAGNYQVFVTDENNCVGQGSVILSAPNPLSLSALVTPLDCSGNNNGSIDINPQGGTPDYDFSWIGPGGFVSSDEDIFNLAEGDYELIISDANGCQLDSSFVVTQPILISLEASIINPLCAQQNTGAIDITLSGGFPPFNFTWTGDGGFGSPAEDISNLNPGTYQLHVEDSGSCTLDTSFTLIETPGIFVDAVITDINCGGLLAGAIEISISGGAPGYTVEWDGPGGYVSFDEDIFDLAAGTYDLVIADANACSIDTSFTISEPQNIEVLFDAVNPICGVLNGTITATINGGSPEYIIVWSDISTGIPIVIANDVLVVNGLGSGLYQFDLTDAQGCFYSEVIPLTDEPGTVDFNATGLLCFGDANGTIDITISNGTPPYIVDWSGPNGFNSNNEDISDLVGGDYILTVTDANDCLINEIITVDEPEALILDPESVDVFCNGANTGEIILEVFGGIEPYTFEWSGPNGFSSNQQSLTDLAPGSYTLELLDNNLCIADTTVVVEESVLLDISLLITPFICDDATDGSVDLTVNGGTAPYSFEWTFEGGVISTNEDLINLGPGDYSLHLEDALGCFRDTTISIQEAAPIEIAITATAPLCGESNGSLQASVSGGIIAVDYIYEWYDLSNGSPVLIGSAPLLENLSAGIFQLIVYDDLGCNASELSNLSDVGAILDASTTDVLCFGDNNGTIDLTVSGAQEPLIFTWGGPNGYTAATEDIADLFAGEYSIIVDDANGCTFTDLFIINTPEALSFNFVITDVQCAGLENGAITVEVSGGTADYDINWFGENGFSANGPEILNLPAACFDLVVQDANACQADSTVCVLAPVPLDLSAVVTDILCGGEAQGIIDLTISGGTLDYIIEWVGPDAFTAGIEDIGNLFAGAYDVQVTDANNCAITQTFVVNESPAIVTDPVVINPLCPDQANGSIQLQPSGGAEPLNIEWFGPNGYSAFGDAIDGLLEGAYTWLLVDANGCQQSDELLLFDPEPLELDSVVVQINCFGDTSGSIELDITGGTPLYSVFWTGPNGFTSFSEDIFNLAPGTYQYQVGDGNACVITGEIQITEPSELIIDLDNTLNPSCEDSFDGLIELSISGGVADYTIVWTDADGNVISDSEDLIDLGPGIYNVSVSDANGCVAEVNDIELIPLSVVSATAQADIVACFGSGPFLLEGLAEGEDEVSWTDQSGLILSDSLSVIVDPVPGEYYFVFEASTGLCSATDTVFVSILSLPLADAGEDQLIFPEEEVIIGGDPTTDNAINLIVWSPAENLNDETLPNPTVIGLSNDEYFALEITDSNGCVAYDTVFIGIIPEINIPDGFTPNGDGMNEFWVIGNVELYPSIVVEIYNRWGELLFRSEGYKEPWDGLYNGDELPIGTYYYVIDTNEPEFQDKISGPLTILR
jgi:gliding motility-associated-like protein